MRSRNPWNEQDERSCRDKLALKLLERNDAVMVTAGAVLTLAAFSAGLRTIRRLRRTIQADALRRRLPPEPVRPRSGRADAPAADLGRILEIRAVDDP